MMSNVSDEVTNNEAVYKRLWYGLHKECHIEMAAIAYGIFWAKNEVRNSWSHEAGECQKSLIGMN